MDLHQQPTDPNDPNDCFDFECYYFGTGEPATIRGITAGEGLSGNVDLMVRHTNTPYWGARDVQVLQFSDPVTANIKQLEVAGNLGYTDPNDPNTTYPTRVHSLDGYVYVYQLGSDLYADTITESGDLDLVQYTADIDVADDVLGSITLQVFYANEPHDLHIGGSMSGTMTLGLDDPY